MAKRLWFFLGIAALCLGLAGGAAAGPKDEAKALKIKVNQAAQLLAKKGPEALKEFNDPQSKWAAEPYIFAYKFDGTCLALPKQLDLVGSNRLGLKDDKGRLFVAEMAKWAKSNKGEGWVEYKYPRPDNPKGPSVKKVAWVVGVPGQDAFVGAGLYGLSKGDVLTLRK
jgi:hypothetical protein